MLLFLTFTFVQYLISGVEDIWMVLMSFVDLSFLLRFVGGGDVFVVTLSLLCFFVGGKLL
jgi:hypothetical protein